MHAHTTPVLREIDRQQPCLRGLGSFFAPSKCAEKIAEDVWKHIKKFSQTNQHAVIDPYGKTGWQYIFLF
jgi:hypothetical protein